MDRCIHTNPIKKPADIDHAYRGGHPHVRRREPVSRQQKFDGPARRHRAAGAAGVPQSVGEVGPVVEVRGRRRRRRSCSSSTSSPPGVQFAGFSFHVGSQGCVGRAVPGGAARHPGPRHAHPAKRLGVRDSGDRHRRRLPVSLPRADADHRPRSPTSSTTSLGADRDEFTLLAEPGLDPGRRVDDARHERDRNRGESRRSLGTTSTTACTARTRT